MAKLKGFLEPMFSHLANLPCPSFDNHPWIGGPALSQRRVSIISTAGLHRRGDRPFESMTGDYRIGASPSGTAFTHWFWTETAAGQVLYAVKQWCLKQDDQTLRMAGNMLLVPLGQQ